MSAVASSEVGRFVMGCGGRFNKKKKRFEKSNLFKVITLVKYLAFDSNMKPNKDNKQS